MKVIIIIVLIVLCEYNKIIIMQIENKVEFKVIITYT